MTQSAVPASNASPAPNLALGYAAALGWVALQEGAAVGADVRFMDLPAWSKDFHGRRNRYADRGDRYGQVMRALCEKLGVDSSDALWDQLFEQPEEPAVLAERLSTYFEALHAAANQ